MQAMIKKPSKVVVTCNCLKSKCTKNYCECFTQGKFYTIERVNVMNSANVQDARTKEKQKKDIDLLLIQKKEKEYVIAKNQTV